MKAEIIIIIIIILRQRYLYSPAEYNFGTVIDDDALFREIDRSIPLLIGILGIRAAHLRAFKNYYSAQSID